MLVTLSPAKKLDWDPVEVPQVTHPDFAKEALSLAKTARNLALGDLKKLMSLSDDLARLNRDRFKAYQAEPSLEITRPAALAFAGDTYLGLEAKLLDDDALLWAQDHLRILSGLYGALRPLDHIQPYRLEMGSRLKTRRGSSLYAYWGSEISKSLNKAAAGIDAQHLINCASKEYFGAVDVAALKPTITTPQFLEVKDGTPKIVSFFAKKARGSMARFIIENRLDRPEQILDFDLGGYVYDPSLSKENEPAFTRPYQTVG